MWTRESLVELIESRFQGSRLVLASNREPYSHHRLKDPLGVLEAYRMVKKRNDCQLLLAGGGADDDPEGMQVVQEVREAAAADPDIPVPLLPPSSDVEINALV